MARSQVSGLAENTQLPSSGSARLLLRFANICLSHESSLWYVPEGLASSISGHDPLDGTAPSVSSIITVAKLSELKHREGRDVRGLEL